MLRPPLNPLWFRSYKNQAFSEFGEANLLFIGRHINLDSHSMSKHQERSTDLRPRKERLINEVTLIYVLYLIHFIQRILS